MVWFEGYWRAEMNCPQCDKSQMMIQISLKLFMLKLNQQILPKLTIVIFYKS